MLKKTIQTIKLIPYYIISFFKKICVIIVTSLISWIMFDFIFSELYWLSIPLSLYITYTIHFTIKYFTSFYDIPYDHEAAYYKALREYESKNMELVKGEIVNTPSVRDINMYQSFRVYFDFEKLRNSLAWNTQYKSDNNINTKLIAA